MITSATTYGLISIATAYYFGASVRNILLFLLHLFFFLFYFVTLDTAVTGYFVTFYRGIVVVVWVVLCVLFLLGRLPVPFVWR